MAKNDQNQGDEKKFGAPADQLSEEAYADSLSAPHPDAANYVLQPTSYPIPEPMGDVPEGRFQEEVLKGSDDEKSGAVDAHPAENQPRYGVRAESDSSGSSASSDKGKK
jgi:hypothetical protein